MEKDNAKNNILLFSNDNNEPNWIKELRINSYNKIGNYNHPSFGPEIKLDIDLNLYCDNVVIPFNIETEQFIACDIHTAFIKYKNLIEKYYNKLIFSDENRYTTLNSTIFLSGYFIYVFKNQKINFPIFNRNVNCDFSKNIVVVDENAQVNIIDYCSSESIFRCDCTEVFVEKGAKCKYLNLNMAQSSSTLVSIKRAQVKEFGRMEWINVIDKSNIYMGYPGTVLKGQNAVATSTTLALADKGKSINVGAKMIHEAPNTDSKIFNFSYISDEGELEVRNLVNIKKTALNSTSKVKYNYCSTGNNSKYDNVPRYIIDNSSSNIDFDVKNDLKMNINILNFIENNFMKLSPLHYNYLLKLIKWNE